jgi:hypothetical protein
MSSQDLQSNSAEHEGQTETNENSEDAAQNNEITTDKTHFSHGGYSSELYKIEVKNLPKNFSYGVCYMMFFVIQLYNCTLIRLPVCFFQANKRPFQNFDFAICQSEFAEKRKLCICYTCQ